MRATPLLLTALLLSAGSTAAAQAGDEHAGHMPDASAPRGAASVQDPSLPAGAAEANARLAASPRHAEWVTVRAGGHDALRAWVVYPERPDKAPVVLVVHEIFGLSNWIRAVADQLAADGFIAIAPDLLSGKDVPEGADGPDPDAARAAIATLDPADVQRRLDAVASYGMSLPAADSRYGIIGFCWGGSTTFSHAVHSQRLGAAVVYYGGSPETATLESVRAPVLGLYGENDARVNATIAPAQAAMTAQGKTFEPVIYPGAGHGFLRAQDGQEGANLRATQAAWPRTLEWLRTYLER